MPLFKRRFPTREQLNRARHATALDVYRREPRAWAWSEIHIHSTGEIVLAGLIQAEESSEFATVRTRLSDDEESCIGDNTFQLHTKQRIICAIKGNISAVDLQKLWPGILQRLLEMTAMSGAVY